MENRYLIDDTRNIDDFKKLSFSEYKKNDVFNVLFKSIESKKVENTCNWISECICSGYFEECWNKMLLYSSDVISINNPLLPNYLYKYNILFYNIYNNINKDKDKTDLIDLRNNQIIRNLFFSISVILTLSDKTKRYNKYPKIKQSDFDFNNISLRLSANSNLLPNDFIQFNEPDELKIIMNEIYYNLKNMKSGYEKCIYWILWILEWEKKMKKTNTTWNINSREVNVQNKYKNDLIWLIWELILLEVKSKNSKIKTQILSLYELYIYDFKISKKYKRLPYLYQSIVYLTHDISFDKQLLTNNVIYLQTQNNNNKMFETKKIHEKKPVIQKKIKVKKKDKNNQNNDIYKHKLDMFNNMIT